MSFKSLAVALAEALAEDLSPFSAFSMASMAEYGKVGGYADPYLEVKRDALAFLDLCAAIGLPSGLRDVEALPNLASNRLMNEGFFDRERETLMTALAIAEAALRSEPDDALSRRHGALEGSLRRRFEVLVHRSGLDPEALTAPVRSGPSDKIYVSSRWSSRLRDQLADCLSDAGLDPILSADAPSAAQDLDQAARHMRACGGGVFALTPPDATQGAPSLTDGALASGVAEISIAERQLGRRLMILAQERLVPRLPERLRDKPIFTLANGAMDEIELSLFRTVASRTPWLMR